MNIFAATTAAAKPEHSLYNVIFWLLVLLAVLIATLALKTLFTIWLEAEEIRRIRREEHRRASGKLPPVNNHSTAKVAKKK